VSGPAVPNVSPSGVGCAPDSLGMSTSFIVLSGADGSLGCSFTVGRVDDQWASQATPQSTLSGLCPRGVETSLGCVSGPSAMSV